MDPAVTRHCAEIERCRQRGRMLSVVDLIDAGTFTPEVAAYALARIGAGCSFLVGARPGSAGKTTVMGALLNLAPADLPLRHADDLQTLRQAQGQPRSCYICHEISHGPIYAYLWDEALRAYFELAGTHLLATNLHADTFDQAADQVVRQNGVSEERWRQIGLMVFLAVRRTETDTERRVSSVWEGDGRGPHRCVYTGEQGLVGSTLVGPEALAASLDTIGRLRASGARSLAEVRSFLIG